MKKTHSPLSSFDGIESALSQAANSFLEITKSYRFGQIEEQLEKFNQVLKSEMLEIEQINCLTAMSSQLEQLTNYQNALSQLSSGVFESAINELKTPALQEALKQIDGIRKSSIFIESNELLRVSTIIESYQYPSLLKQMEQVISQIPTFDAELINLAKSFDLTSIQFHEDGALSFDGMHYASTDLDVQLKSQLSEAKTGSLPLREKIENLKKQMWLILLIIQMIIFLPQLSEAVEYYSEIVSQIEEIVQQTRGICFTIRDSSYLRESASSKAKVVMIIPYDTPLEITETIPRWYQVQYTSPDGEIISGWISKISVEIGE